MIGEVRVGKSFFHCINYCLEDKRTLTEKQKVAQSLKDGLQHKDRAEVLAFHQCYGNGQELADQFKDVMKLSKRVEKPVFHFMVSLSPGERLTKQQWVEIGQAVAKTFEVDDHQYLIILHKDSAKQHIHVVANRVGYDGKAAKTSNDYLHMTQLCRRLEKQYQVQEVLSPRRFLSKEERLLPRHDSRKEKMKNDIRQTLSTSKHYPDFEKKMQTLGYQVIKGRGITFIDDKKVRVKGSELGFSLPTIEKILTQKQTQEIRQEMKKTAWSHKIEEPTQKKQPEQLTGNPEQKRPAIAPLQRKHRQTINTPDPVSSLADQLTKNAASLLYELLKPEYVEGGGISPELLREANKKKKRKRHRL